MLTLRVAGCGLRFFHVIEILPGHSSGRVVAYCKPCLNNTVALLNQELRGHEA